MRWAGGLGIFAIVYTDIERDGMLSGVNLPATVAITGRAIYQGTLDLRGTLFLAIRRKARRP